MRGIRQSPVRLSLMASVLLLLTTAGWSQQPSLRWLGTLPGYNWSEAYGVSADGAVVVGVSDGRAFRWTAAGGMQDLGTLGGARSMAYAVSADGAVVVGGAYNAERRVRAFRWTVDGGMQDLGTLGGCCSYAHGVSADGAVVVGESGGHAFRWTPWSGMQDLGTLGGAWSWAYGVSADGTVVVGVAYNDEAGYYAVRWTASGGWEDLNTTYASLLTPGSRLAEARAISPDGRYIVGWGRNAATRRYEAFLLDTGFPLHGDVDRNGCVGDADLLAVLFAFGGQGYRNEDLNWDGIIDDADLLEVLFHFGSGC